MLSRIVRKLLRRVDPIDMPRRVFITHAEMEEMQGAVRRCEGLPPREAFDAYILCYEAYRREVPISDFTRDSVLEWARKQP